MKRTVFLALLCCLWGGVAAQNLNNDFGSSATNRNSDQFDRTGAPRDTSAVNDGRTVPVGLNAWKIDTWGNRIEVPVDTLQLGFQHTNDTGGPNGHYAFLGNLASPRWAHVYMERPDYTDAFFIAPYNFTYKTPENVIFTNTKSPFVNLAYYTYSGSTKQEERFKAYYAVNANRKLGFGFDIDYVYARGQYSNQATAQFNGNLYAYYQGDRYNMQFVFLNHNMKLAENGGLTDDRYVTRPLEMAEGRKTYSTEDMPTRLSETWNRNTGFQTLLTHRYNLGFEKTVTKIVDKKPEEGKDKDNEAEDKIIPAKNMKAGKIAEKDTLQIQEFVPVTSFVHTLQLSNHSREYITKNQSRNKTYYLHNFFGSSDRDENSLFNVENTLSLVLREGFNKWAKAGLMAYARHEYRRFSLPDSVSRNTEEVQYTSISEQNVVIGAELAKREGKTLHYAFRGEMPVWGTDIGEFVLEGNADINVKLFSDTIRVIGKAFIKNQNPVFYFGRMHTRHLWWDQKLNNVFRTRLEGTLAIDRLGTELNVGVENIKNYAYLTDASVNQEDGSLLHNVAVGQTSGNIQVIGANLKQPFHLGFVHLENEVTFQKSSNERLLPLPRWMLYHNLYFEFGLSKKVLKVQLGADVRYFTKYAVPDYSPAIGQFMLQNESTRYELGDYPLISCYANLHLKRTRFFVSYYNAFSELGKNNYFQIPHYPLNPTGFRIGLSWNFFD